MTHPLQADTTTPSAALDVVTFWRDAGPDAWFAKNDDFDREFTRRFLDRHMAVARREHDDWLSSPYGNLALILLVDQFPRNAFRGTAHIVATDPLARYFAGKLLEAGFIEHIDGPLKVFACVPFSHSESLDDQVRAVQLYREHAPDSLNWAVHHHGIISRYGRFPHRNRLLGRESAAAEQQFLDEGGFGG